MTAIPRMTGTFHARYSEIAAAVAVGLLQVVLNVRNNEYMSVSLFAVQTLFLAVFIVRRFLVHKRIPFFGMIFIPAAFLQALLGVVLFFAFDGARRDFVTLLCGEAFFINLIIGVGTAPVKGTSKFPLFKARTRKLFRSSHRKNRWRLVLRGHLLVCAL